jgi:outer membrane murein-binding lipoprotein Lpp
MPKPAAVLPVLVLLAGCGGVSKADFVAKADSICSAQAKQLESREPQTMQDLEQAANHNAPILDKTIRKLDKLEPPKELKIAFDKFLVNTRLRASLTKQAGDAAAEQNLQKIQEIGATSTKGRADGKQLGKDVGFKSCGQG